MTSDASPTLTNVGKGHALRIGLGNEQRSLPRIHRRRRRHLPRVPRCLRRHPAEPKTRTSSSGASATRTPRCNAPPLRRLYSWTHQAIIRILFRLDVRDTQVGIKLMDRRVLADVLAAAPRGPLRSRSRAPRARPTSRPHPRPRSTGVHRAAAGQHHLDEACLAPSHRHSRHLRSSVRPSRRRRRHQLVASPGRAGTVGADGGRSRRRRRAASFRGRASQGAHPVALREG